MSSAGGIVESGMPARVRILMIGIGGYGYWYLKTLLEECDPAAYELVGVVDPQPENSALLPAVHEAGIGVHESVETFFNSGGAADLAVISSPIHFHVPQSITCLEQGCHVLCDKPLGAAVQEADDLIRARDASDRWVSVGYQWSFSDAIRALKADLMAGRWGRPLRAATLCLWPRGRDYYARNDWAGRLRSGEGRWILDTPLNNAMAHFMHNLLYLLGPETERSAEPVAVTAEMARAYEIETADTVAARVETAAGTELLFLGSHATGSEHPPVFRIECEKAVISYAGGREPVRAVTADGGELDYGSPEESHQFTKLFRAIEWAGRRGVHPGQAGGRDGGQAGRAEVICPPEAARAQTLVVNGAHESVRAPVTVRSELVDRAPDGSRLWIRNLDEVFGRCYAEGRLPSESGPGDGIEWAQAGERIDFTRYVLFSR